MKLATVLFAAMIAMCAVLVVVVSSRRFYFGGPYPHQNCGYDLHDPQHPLNRITHPNNNNDLGKRQVDNNSLTYVLAMNRRSPGAKLTLHGMFVCILPPLPLCNFQRSI